MNIRDIPLFCCLSCKQDLSLSIFQEGPKGEEKVETGVLFCPTCKLFYPISEGVIFLLDRGYYKGFDLETFLEKWSDKFDFNNFKVLNRKIGSEKLKQLNFYDVDAELYDALVTDCSFWKASDSNIIDEWLKEMPREGVVLDLGCGTGKSAIPIYNSGRRVIATDISMGMIRKAIKKSYDFGAGGITYFLSDVEDLPLNRDCFSAVMSSGVLHHLVDPCSVVKNIARLLKPGGCFYSHENHASLARPLFDLLMKANKLWNEEAGSHPLFRIKEIKDLLEVSGLCPDIRTSVFLPPHIFNLISYRLGKVILSVTDSLFGRRFLFRDFGGLLIIKGRKIK